MFAINSLPRFPSICLAIILAYGIVPAHSEIVIGVPYPQTGEYQDLGTPVRDGVETAVEFWNRNGGVLIPRQKIKVEWTDDMCEGSRASQVANQLVDPARSIRVVIGHNCSGAALAAAPIYNARGLLMISPSATNPDLTEAGYNTVFRMVGRDEDQADAAASYVAAKPEFRNIAILHDDQPYGIRLAELMRRSLLNRDISVKMFTQVESPKNDVPDLKKYDQLVIDLKEKNIDIVYYAGYPPAGVSLRKKTWMDDLKVPMLSGDGFLTKDYVQVVGGDAAAQSFITNTPDSRDNPAAGNAMMALDAAGKKVLPQTLQAYAALDVWAQAVAIAGTPESAAVARALRSRKIKTIIGEIKFDRKGDRSDLEPLFVLYTWRNDRFVELDPGGGKRLGLVCRVQAGLGALDYDVKWTDGLLGPFTRNLIEKFYKRKGKIPLRTIDEAMATEIEGQVTYETNSVRENDPSYERKVEAFRQWKKLGIVCLAQAGLKVLNHYHGKLDGLSGHLDSNRSQNIQGCQGNF